MHSDERLGDLPEVLPLRRVTPLWRILAVLEAVALLGLLLILCVFGIALIESQRAARVPVATPAAPPMAVAGVGMAPMMGVMGDEEAPADPHGLPYPVHADLRERPPAPDGAAGAKETPRQRFLGLSQEIWHNSRGYYPNHVLISPDGLSLAFAAGENLVAGPFDSTKEIGAIPDPNLPGGMPGVMMGPAYGPVQPPREHLLRRIVGIPSWSADSQHIFFARASGQLARCDVAAGVVEPLPFHGDAPAALPTDPNKLAFVRSQPTSKPDLRGQPAANDPTEVVLGDLATQELRVLIKASPSTWTHPTFSPNGKRLALVSDRGHEGAQPRRWRVFVFEMSGGEPVALTPPANVVGSVCWLANGQCLIYARSQEPPPPDYWTAEHKGLHRTMDLFLWDFTANREIRLSRGGSCYSPSLAQVGDNLYYVAWTPDATGANVRLRRVGLAQARAFAAKEPTPPSRDAESWRQLVEDVLRESQVGADVDGTQLTEAVRKQIVTAFDRLYRQRFQTEPPSSAAELDQQRRELQALTLPQSARRPLVLIVGVVEGDYLCRQHAASWHLVKGKVLDADRGTVAPERETPFGQVLNPFHPVIAQPVPGEETGETAERVPGATLVERLRQAEGRPFVLTNDAEAGLAVAVSWTDPALAKAAQLFQEDKEEEAEHLLLALLAQPRHKQNYNLALRVGKLLLDHKRKAALVKLMEQQRDLQPRDARKYNLLGLALLLPRRNEGDPEPNPPEAIDAFKNALRCDLHFEAGYLNLAQAYQQAHDPAAAKACLRRYQEFMPQGRYVGDAQRRLAELVDKDGN